MAFSVNTPVGDGVTKQFAVNFTNGLFSRDSVHVFVEGEVDGLGEPIERTFTWINDGLIELDGAAPGAGVVVNIRRIMDKDEPAVDFEDGEILTEATADRGLDHLLNSIHELMDGYGFGSIRTDMNLNGNLIRNLGEPTEPTDAARLSDISESASAAVLRQELQSDDPAQGSDMIAHTGTDDTVTEALDKRTIFVGSVAELEALSLAEGANVYLTQEGRAGEFVVKTGTPPSDPQKGIYIVLANGNYAMRRYDGITSNSTVAPEWFGANTSDTDSHVHLQAALNHIQNVLLGGKLKINGIFRVSDSLSVSGVDLSIEGSGVDLSGLIFTNDVDGIVFDNSSGNPSADSRKNFSVSNLSIIAAGGFLSGKAISAKMPTGTIVGDSSTVTLSNVDIRGSDSYSGDTDHWNTGIYLEDTGNVSIGRVRVFHAKGIIDQNSKALHIKAVTGTNLRFFIDDFHTLWHDDAFVIEGNSTYRVEGIYLNNFEFVGPQRGINIIGSEATALEVTNGHIDAEDGCIISNVAGTSGLNVSGCYLQNGDKATGVAKTSPIITVNGGINGWIAGNYIFNSPDANQIGIYLQGSSRFILESNTFDNSFIGYEFNGTSQQCRAFGNIFSSSVSTKFVNNSTDSYSDYITTREAELGSVGAGFRFGRESDVALDGAGKGTISLSTPFKSAIYGGIANYADPGDGQARNVLVDLIGSSASEIVIYVNPVPADSTASISYIVIGE